MSGTTGYDFDFDLDLLIQRGWGTANTTSVGIRQTDKRSDLASETKVELGYQWRPRRAVPNLP